MNKKVVCVIALCGLFGSSLYAVESLRYSPDQKIISKKTQFALEDKEVYPCSTTEYRDKKVISSTKTSIETYNVNADTKKIEEGIPFYIGDEKTISACKDKKGYIHFELDEKSYTFR